jgi:hypothetical protein
MSYLWLAPLLLAAGFLGYRAAGCWADAKRLAFPPVQRLRWALEGAVLPSRYWWGARIDALPEGERQALLARETAALGLERAGNLHCPLCGAEVPGAWTLDAGGQPAIGPRPIECPGCDFRLDACRHCARFLPGAPGGPGFPSLAAGDLTFGRCAHYKAWQEVEQTTTTEMAKQMRARGWERIRGPLPIADSFLPPDHCTAFQPDRRRLKAGGVPWPDARRAALLRLPAPPHAGRPAPDAVTETEDELWLL